MHVNPLKKTKQWASKKDDANKGVNNCNLPKHVPLPSGSTLLEETVAVWWLAPLLFPSSLFYLFFEKNSSSTLDSKEASSYLLKFLPTN